MKGIVGWFKGLSTTGSVRLAGGAVVVIAAVGGCSTSESSAVATTTTTPTALKTHFGNGTHVVGTDIAPGTYRTATASRGCYWARLSGLAGDLPDIIATESTNGPAVVTIAASDKGFESQNCGTWSQDLTAVTESRTTFGEGTYITGTDFQPGTYHSSGGSGCYWARLRNFSDVLDSIIANENMAGPTAVTIQPLDKGFTSSNCGTWTKTG